MSREHPTTAFRRVGLLQLSWPLIVVTLLTLGGALGNVVILSMASPELNAAVATANQLLGVLYDVSVLFSIGALVVVAQLLGAGREETARQATGVVLRASSLLGLGMALSIALAGPLLLRAINTPQAIVADATWYLWIVAGGLAFNAYIVAATAVLRAWGRTTPLLILGIVVNLVDVALLFLFVMVLELGPVGAALPTLLVRGVGVLLLELMVRRASGTGLFVGRVRPKTGGTPAWRRFLPEMTRLSVPTVLENGAYNLAIVLTLSMMNRLGTEAINARSYALTLTALVTGLILALAQGNETIVGWDVGSRSAKQAMGRTLRTATGTALAAAILAAALWFFADGALAIFGADPATVAGARQALAVSIVLLPLSAFTSVVYGALRSAGDVVRPMLISIAASAMVLLPLSWLFIERLGWGVAGVFWALVAAEAVRAVWLTLRWLRGAWTDLPAVSARLEAEAQLGAGEG